MAAAQRRRTLFALGALVALALRLFWLVAVEPAPGIDFYQFWIVGRAEAAGGMADPYSESAREELAALGKQRADASASPRLAAAVQYRTHVETFSTPFLYAALAALSSADYDASLLRFGVLRLVCLVAGVALLCRLAGCDLLLTGVWLLALLWFSEPVRSDARVGNVNALQLAGLAGFLALARAPGDARQAGAGALLGALLAFKPTLGLVAAFVALDAALRGAWRRLAAQGVGFAAAALAVVAASSAWFGSPRVWLDWLAALPGLEQSADVSVANGNYALPRLAAELGVPLPSAALIAFFVAAFAGCAWRSARSAPADDGPRDLLVAALGAAAAVVGVRLGWLHYFLLVTPLAIALFRRLSGPAALAAVGAASLLALGTPVRVFAESVPPHGDAALYLVGAGGLLAIGFAELARARSRG